MTYVNEASVTAIGVIFAALTIVSLAMRTYGWRQSYCKPEIDDILVIPTAVSFKESRLLESGLINNLQCPLDPYSSCWCCHDFG